MASENITSRICKFISMFNSDYRWFELLTDISASKWRDLDRGKTKAATASMIEALCRIWPEFAYWFVTGSGESPRGQATPDEYFQWEYGTPGIFIPSGIELQRESNGILESKMWLRLEGVDRTSKEAELTIVNYSLWATGLLSYDDAQRLSLVFWENYARPLKPGKNFAMDPLALKIWINGFQIKNQPT